MGKIKRKIKRTIFDITVDRKGLSILKKLPGSVKEKIVDKKINK